MAARFQSENYLVSSFAPPGHQVPSERIARNKSCDAADETAE
jgi:hypothetical protein